MNVILHREWVASKCGLRISTEEFDVAVPLGTKGVQCFGCQDEDCFFFLRERDLSRDSMACPRDAEAIARRALAVPAYWSIEERPRFGSEKPTYALYSGRWSPPPMMLGGLHGLNLLGLHEPDLRWGQLRPLLENAQDDILWLLIELEKKNQEIRDLKEGHVEDDNG